MNAFAAVLLAGGQSRRMGRDKALLPLADGRLLWQRQLAVLRELAPAELFVSGPARDGFPADIPLLVDETPGLGPLAGIAAALGAMQSSHLVVLAIDMPRMRSDFLRGLIEDDVGLLAQGRIPRSVDGFYEPLAAVYPRAALSVAEKQLRSGELSLQSFVRVLLADGLVKARPLRDDEAGLFTNWNTPADLPP